MSVALPRPTVECRRATRCGTVQSDNRAEAGVPPSLADHLRRVFRATGLLLAAVAVINGAVFAFLYWRVGPALDTAVVGAQAVRESHEAMLDQETGLRGFLLTDDEAFLEPYQQGAAVLAAAVAAADRELASDDRFSDELLAMRLAQQIWLDQWAERAATGQPFPDEEALRAFLEEGKAQFDAYRAAEQRLVDGLVEERASLLDRQRAIIGVAGLGALALGATLLVVAARERGRLSAMVTEPMDDLRSTMLRLERGDLDARAAGSGASEFAELATALDSMAGQLNASLQLGREQAAALQRRTDRQAGILTMARDVAGSLNLRYVLRSVGEHGRRLAAAEQASVWLVDEDDDETLREAWAHREGSGGPGSGAVELGSGLVGEVARDGRSKTSDALGTPAVAVATDDVGALAVPMIVGARVVGVLEARFATPKPLDAEVVDLMEALASHGGTAIEAARLHETTKELSQIDALTRLHNRRRLDIDLATELGRADRYDRPLAFVMIDVDHFKQFNDTFGHQRGDEVLQELARLLTTTVRASDTVYRYGGEELSILLRETDEEAARELTERLRATIERHFAQRPGLPGVTASFGLAARGHGPTAPEALIRAADAALYDAKRAGRNQVVVAGTRTSG